MQEPKRDKQQQYPTRVFTSQLKIGDGTDGSSNKRLNYPWGIAFNPHTQHVLVSDGHNHRVKVFDRHTHDDDGHLKYVSTIGSEGSAPGQFDHPRGLAIQPITHRVLVCDAYNHRIQVMAEDEDEEKSGHYHHRHVYSTGDASKAESSLDGGFNRPFGVDCQSNGDIAVADSFNHRVQLFDSAGRYLHKFGTKGDQDDQFNSPYDVKYLAHRFSPSSSASSLLLVADRGNHRVSVWSGDGQQHISNFKVEGSPTGLCVDMNGLIHVSCNYPYTVQIYDPRNNFQLLQTLGQSTRRGGNKPGELNCPAGMCVDDTNTLMVVECWNHRVQFFR